MTSVLFSRKTSHKEKLTYTSLTNGKHLLKALVICKNKFHILHEKRNCEHAACFFVSHQYRSVGRKANEDRGKVRARVGAKANGISVLKSDANGNSTYSHICS